MVGLHVTHFTNMFPESRHLILTEERFSGEVETRMVESEERSRSSKLIPGQQSKWDGLFPWMKILDY